MTAQPARFQVEELTIHVRGLAFPAMAAGEGPLVLCLHGFPDCLRTFRLQLPALAAAGYRAVAPALRGYAPGCVSDDASSNVLEAARDAVEMVSALGETRAHLVGHDWGAVAAYLAGALAPDTWRSITAMAVPHPLGLLEALPRVPRQLKRSWYMLALQLPYAHRLFEAADFAMLDKLWRDWSPGLEMPLHEMHAVKSTFLEHGVLRGAIAYYRNLLDAMSESSRTGRQLLAKPIQPPVLALTGNEDGCIDTRVFDHAMGEARFTRLVVERMNGVGHFLHLEAPERVNARLLAWLAENS
jgi:pimeloyl-ACP methyl ester carboxylesterase